MDMAGAGIIVLWIRFPDRAWYFSAQLGVKPGQTMRGGGQWQKVLN